MIVSEIYTGTGLGNQIWHYVVTRLIAEKNGYKYGIQRPERWKGAQFMPIDFGETVVGGDGPEGGPPISLPEGITSYYPELKVPHPATGDEIGAPDPKLFQIADNTKIEGTLQKMSYIQDHRDKIIEWLSYGDQYKVTDYASDDICVIQFRGGDYLTGNSYLPPEYYQCAAQHFRSINPNMRFVTVTDDPENARRFIPFSEVVGSAVTEEKDPLQGSIGWYRYPGGPVGIDYSILNTAKNAIVSASTFAFWPVWTNKEATVIAPKYWFDWRISDGWWRPEDAIVEDWYWLDNKGDLYEGSDCIKEWKSFK